jgi:cell division transport system permease protein
MENFKRVLRFGLQNYLRNGWLSLATTFILAMTLFIVAVFSLQTYVIKTTTKSIEDKLDMSIYMNDAPSEESVLGLVAEVRAYPEVKHVEYLDKHRVIEEWKKLQVADSIKEHVNEQNNPLPRTIKVQATDPALLDSIADKINVSTLSGELRMSYRDNRPVIQHLIAQSKKTTKNGIIVSSIFIVIAIVFVYNTIRIIIRFRQDEIAIMKLVGATDSFVRGPFMVEGVLYGVFAGLITLVALFFYLQNGLSESTSVVTSPDSLVAEGLFQFFSDNIVMLGGGLIGLAVILAVLCSSISVHYHLKR